MHPSPEDGPSPEEPAADTEEEQEQGPPAMPDHLAVKIDELTPHSRKVFVRVRVLEVAPPQTVEGREGGSRTVTEAVVGDETATIRMTLWDEEAGQVEQGETIEVHNGYVGLLRGHMRLYVGRYGELFHSQEPLADEVKVDLDLSELEYRDTRPPPGRFGRGGGGRDRGGPRRGGGGARGGRGRGRGGPPRGGRGGGRRY